MRKYMLGVVVVLAFATSCLKSNQQENICDTYDPCALKASPGEVTEIENYLSAEGITGAVKHCSGMYYKVTDEGSGLAPTICSSVAINYKGKLSSGHVFDSTKTGVPYVNYPVNLIKGWQNGLPMIKKGGSIQLFIPPSLGYGQADLTGIPAGSMLIFDIELVDVQP